MKTLSIIGIIIGSLWILGSLVIIADGPDYGIFGLLILFVSLYLLAFSIVACIQAFKKRQIDK
jgi:hypothetical protein